MKDIAYLCLSRGWGGLEMNQIRSAKAMLDRGHRVILIGTTSSPIIKEAAKQNISYYTINKTPGHYQWRLALQLVRFLQKSSFEHLFFRNNREMSLAASIAFFAFGKIRVHYFMEMALGGNRKQWFRALRYSFFSTWVCPLNYLTLQVKENANFAPQKIKQIPSGISLNQLKAIDKLHARQKLNWPSASKLLVVVGRIDPKKRQDFVWEMFSQRPEDNEYLIFAGESTADESNSFEMELRLKTAAHPKGKQVIWAGFQENISAVYSAADLIIMPAAFETFGMATLEALLVDCPVVGANNGGSAELINTYGGGCLFDYTSTASLHEAIDQIFMNNFPKAKREELKQHFDFNNVCLRIENEVLN